MSTRCNVVVLNGSSKIYLYRHHDGYLAETGADLAEKLKAVAGEPGARFSPSGMADKFVRSMLGSYYEARSFDPVPRPIYELTTDLHGDIERCYWIYFGRGGLMGGNEENFTVMYAARPGNYPELGDWTSVKTRFDGGLAEFIASVNADRESCNRRIRELKATSKAYADCGEYPMIELKKEVA